MEKYFHNQHLTVRFGADSIRNDRMDRDFTQSKQSLLINAEIGCDGTSFVSGGGWNIIIFSSISVAGHSRMCGREQGKSRCGCHVTKK